MPACRCCRSCAVTVRPRARSSSTPSCSWRRRCCRGAGEARDRCTSSALSRWEPCSSGSPNACDATRRRGTRCSSSTTRSCISRCSSRRWRWTRWSDGSRTRPQERPPGLDAVRRLRAALRRLRRGRAALSPFPVVDGIWLARPDGTGTGEPVAVKDLLDTAGLAPPYGSGPFVDQVPAVSADAVRLLEESGYAVAGKTNLHEFAYGISSQNAHFGTVPNPAAPGRLAGGSSGGSAAAIAAGDVELALGTDSAGSIRIPAAWCGVVGFKPTPGLVSVEGCFPLAPSYDVVGPLASTVEGCERLLRVLAPGFEPIELESLEELELGVAWLDRAVPLGGGRGGEAASLSPRRREIELPLAPPNRADFMREVADVHRVLFSGNEELYGENVRGKIERCLRVRDEEVAAAEAERAEYCERFLEAADGVDLVVIPTVLLVAPPADADELALRLPATDHTYPFSSLGWPALALPCGPAEKGLPASVQLAAPRGEDTRVLAAGRLLETLLPSRGGTRLSL